MATQSVEATAASNSSRARVRPQEGLFERLLAVNGMFKVDRTSHPEDLRSSGNFLFKVAQHLLDDGLDGIEGGRADKDDSRALEGISLLYASTMLLQMSRLFNEAAAGQEAKL